MELFIVKVGRTKKFIVGEMKCCGKELNGQEKKKYYIYPLLSHHHP